jgi:hypothetical protein
MDKEFNHTSRHADESIGEMVKCKVGKMTRGQVGNKCQTSKHLDGKGLSGEWGNGLSVQPYQLARVQGNGEV